MVSSSVSSTITSRNSDDLAAAVRQACGDRVPLIDYGLAHANLGHAPSAEHTRLSQAVDPSNKGILEHYMRDLTVRAAAGITIAALQAALKPTNQFVPLDADDDITLGEVIHHNMYGPLRAGYGSIRDLLLGLHYIDGDGRDIHVGGRTVKNVAGYDISRFLVGSLGELGIVHEATLRTYAIPEHVLEVELSLRDPRVLDEHCTDLILSDAKPTHLSYCYHCGRQKGDGDWFVHLAYFGKHTANLVQLRALELFAEQMQGTHIIGSNDSTLDRDSAERTARRGWRRSDPAIVKIIVPPAQTGEVCMRLHEWMQANQSLQVEALPVHGCVFAGGMLDAASARGLDVKVNETVAALGGMRAWIARPNGAEAIEPFGPPQSDWVILKKLKRTMDPHNVFNPGRFLR